MKTHEERVEYCLDEIQQAIKYSHVDESRFYRNIINKYFPTPPDNKLDREGLAKVLVAKYVLRLKHYPYYPSKRIVAEVVVCESIISDFAVQSDKPIEYPIWKREADGTITQLKPAMAIDKCAKELARRNFGVHYTIEHIDYWVKFLRSHFTDSKGVDVEALARMLCHREHGENYRQDHLGFWILRIGKYVTGNTALHARIKELEERVDFNNQRASNKEIVNIALQKRIAELEEANNKYLQALKDVGFRLMNHGPMKDDRYDYRVVENAQAIVDVALGRKKGNDEVS